MLDDSTIQLQNANGHLKWKEKTNATLQNEKTTKSSAQLHVLYTKQPWLAFGSVAQVPSLCSYNFIPDINGINVGCLIVNPPRPLNKMIILIKLGGVSIPIVNFWNLIAGIMEVGAEVVEAKEEDEEEEEKKERRLRRRTTKLELRKKVSTIAMPGAGLFLLFWGLQRGYLCGPVFLLFLIRVL